MSSWRDHILDDLVPGIAPVTLAADPDCLLLEEELLGEIQARGFDLLTFDDPVAFRLAHETRFRTAPDRSGSVARELLLRFGEDDVTAAPHDLLQEGRALRFTLAGLFPGLNGLVLADLDRGDLDALYRARKESSSEELGETATKDLVLDTVFGVRPTEIGRPTELLHVLLRRHYRGVRIPETLDERLIEALQRKQTFKEWPLGVIVPDREAFFAFLQERWPVFLDGSGGETPDACETKGRHGLTISGPANLPLGDHDVRAYVDNLFTEGNLTPVPHEKGAGRHGAWVTVGIRKDPGTDRRLRLAKLLNHTAGTIPEPGARHAAWLAFAWRWAELGALWWTTDAAARQNLSKERAALDDLRHDVDLAFTAWIELRYDGLHNQPPVPPVMVHHLPRYLARRLEEAPSTRTALIVVDGLAVDQWITLRAVLGAQRPALGFRTAAVFAWAPTITSVSRQAIFAGRPPFYFGPSIHTTEKEQSLWTRFWADQGLTNRQIAYVKGLGGGARAELAELLSRPELRVVGGVVHTVDDIMHGMELGTAGMHNQIRQWADEGHLTRLLDTLFDEGFTVFLTSDHGNIEARGAGRPSEGSLATTRGKRARLYSDATLRDQVLARFPSAVAWARGGLPPDCHPLLARGRKAFAPEGSRVVGHGGASLEELVVPLVEIERRTT